MAGLTLLLAGCAATTPAAQVAGEAAPVASVAERAVVEGNAEFALRLYDRLRETPGNVFVSPISIAGAFGPVAAGAQGKTRAAIDRAMSFPAGAGQALHPELGGLLRRLERSGDGATLSIANALWLSRDIAMRPAFLRTGREDYGAAVEQLDFTRPEAAAKRINDWADRETRGRIPSLVSSQSLNAGTALIVTNAVYFLGDWADPFEAIATSDQPFYRPGGQARPIPLMHRRGGYRYFETAGFQAIDLPYKDRRLSMTVLLPKARDGLEALEEGLSGPRLREWLERLDRQAPRQVALYLPKLKMEATYNLVPALTALGMGIAFTGGADFGAMAERPLGISRVIHKTFVRIDEKGTEAAAVTAVDIMITGARIERLPTFRADHPFFFLLRDKESGALLFLGRVVAPERP